MLRVGVNGAGRELHEGRYGAHDVQQNQLSPLRDLWQEQLEHLHRIERQGKAGRL